MRTWTWLVASAIGLTAAALTAQTPATKPAAKITIDDLVHIKHPSGHQWTPDGRHVYWTYDDGGINNVWAASADGSGQAVQLISYPDGQTAAGGFWSKDGQTFYYQRAGDLLGVSVNGDAPRPAWPSAARGRGFTLSPDGTRVAFVSGLDLIVHTFAGDLDQRIAHVDGRIGATSWSPDGSSLA